MISIVLKGLLLAFVFAASVVISTTQAQRVQTVVNSVVATTCTAQFVRVIAATGAATCATVDNADLATMVQTTVKGRALAGGTGVPTDLTAAQAAAIIGSVGGAVVSKVGTFTRDMTTATGSQAVTGVGFVPTSLVFFAAISSTTFAQWSVVDSTRSGTAIVTGGAAVVFAPQNSALFLFGTTDSTGFQAASVTTFDSDGFTLSWTKTGSPTGTATIRYLALR